MVYLPFILTVSQRYKKDTGIGTIIALMLPYTLILAVVWIILFVLWMFSAFRWGLATRSECSVPSFSLTSVRRPSVWPSRAHFRLLNHL